MFIISWLGKFKGGSGYSTLALLLRENGLMDAGSDHGSAAKGSAIDLEDVVQLVAIFYFPLFSYHV